MFARKGLKSRGTITIFYDKLIDDVKTGVARWRHTDGFSDFALLYRLVIPVQKCTYKSGNHAQNSTKFKFRNFHREKCKVQNFRKWSRRLIGHLQYKYTLREETFIARNLRD